MAPPNIEREPLAEIERDSHERSVTLDHEPCVLIKEESPSEIEQERATPFDHEPAVFIKEESLLDVEQERDTSFDHEPATVIKKESLSDIDPEGDTSFHYEPAIVIKEEPVSDIEQEPFTDIHDEPAVAIKQESASDDEIPRSTGISQSKGVKRKSEQLEGGSGNELMSDNKKIKLLQTMLDDRDKELEVAKAMLQFFSASNTVSQNQGVNLDSEQLVDPLMEAVRATRILLNNRKKLHSKLNSLEEELASANSKLEQIEHALQ